MVKWVGEALQQKWHAMAIEGIGAFTALVERTSLRVADEQTANLPERPSGTPLEGDIVSLSATARALLAQEALRIPISAGGSPLNPDNGASGLLIRSDFSGQDFAGNDLSGAVLNFADLTGSNFSNAVLRNASLANADVTGASFFGADLRGANLAGVVGLTADQLRGARVDVTTILPVGILLE